MKTTLFLFLFYSAFATAGFLMGKEGLHDWRNRTRIIRDGVQTKGIVTGLDWSTKGSRGRCAITILEFTTQTGQRQECQSKHCTNINLPEIGEQIELWYDPKDPRQVELEAEKNGWMSIKIRFVLMFGLGGIGVVGLISMLLKGFRNVGPDCE